MKQSTVEMLEKADFVLWEKDEQSPSVVDWASDYDKEVEALIELVARKCMALCRGVGVLNCQNDDIMWATNRVIQEIKDSFEIKE